MLLNESGTTHPALSLPNRAVSLAVSESVASRLTRWQTVWMPGTWHQPCREAPRHRPGLTTSPKLVRTVPSMPSATPSTQPTKARSWTRRATLVPRRKCLLRPLLRLLRLLRHPPRLPIRPQRPLPNPKDRRRSMASPRPTSSEPPCPNTARPLACRPTRIKTSWPWLPMVESRCLHPNPRLPRLQSLLAWPLPRHHPNRIPAQWQGHPVRWMQNPPPQPQLQQPNPQGSLQRHPPKRPPTVSAPSFIAGLILLHRARQRLRLLRPQKPQLQQPARHPRLALMQLKPRRSKTLKGYPLV